MAAPKYHLHLKGYVGGYDFDSDYVDFILAKNEGKEVNVLIDSLGGQSNTALSIFSAFKRHGCVNVHFVGMNASAATIASLGAKHISMDASAMYLVHKCSVAFFEWGNLNADDLQSLIKNIEKQKQDLDKLDANIASIYAKKTKKTPAELLALMKQGGWLTAQEALEWGFVDEITDYDDDSSPVLTNDIANALASQGIPIPNLPKQEQSAFNRFINALSTFFKSNHNKPTPKTMKIFKHFSAVLNNEQLNVNSEGQIFLSEQEAESIDTKLSELHSQVQSLQEQNTTLEEANKSLTETNKSLTEEISALKQAPADTSQKVVENKVEGETNEVQKFLNTRSSAKDLFNMIP